MSDLDLLWQFLGLEISQEDDGIMVTQSKYIAVLLSNFNMDDCNAAPFLLLSGISLEEGKSTPSMDSTIYRQLIEIFLCLTHSRPKFFFHELCINIYAVDSWDPLEGSQEDPSVHSGLKLVGFIDSDLAGDTIDMKSTSMYLFMFGGVPILLVQ